MSHSEATIARIRGATDIVALIGRVVALRRSGSNHMGRCPFHQERTPSFSVNAEKSMFYCFGCHRGGDAIAFVMQSQGLEFPAAVRHLAELAGIELEALTPQQQRLQAQQRTARQALEALSAHAVRALWGEAGGPARAYLAERGVPARMARAWRLGFVPDEQAARAAMAAAGSGPEQQQQAGVLNQAGDRLLFAGRLLFPISDLQGQLVGFGARRLGPGDTAKYLNSRDSATFHKREHLYGLAQAHVGIRQARRVVLVEGYMDVLAAHRCGVDAAVAALGTQLTEQHAAVCRRLADHVVLMLDGDAAGARAAEAAALPLLAAGLQVSVAWLPQGADPASLAQSAGPEALRGALNQATPAVAALMQRAFATPQASIEARVQAARALMPLIDAMGQGLERELYIGRLAGHVGVAPDQLMRFWEAAPKRPARRPGEAGPQGAEDGRGGGHARAGQRGPKPRPVAGGPPGPHGADAAGRHLGPPDDVPHELDGAHAPPGPRGREAASGGDDGPPAALQRPAAPGPEARRELGMVCELLLYPDLRHRWEDLVEYLLCPQVAELIGALAQAGDDPEARRALLEQHVPWPAWRARLLKIRALPAETLDGGEGRANRTFADILRRLKGHHVDEALRGVLRALLQAEARGDATDALLRRKQQLAARKRTLSKASSPEQ